MFLSAHPPSNYASVISHAYIHTEHTHSLNNGRVLWTSLRPMLRTDQIKFSWADCPLTCLPRISRPLFSPSVPCPPSRSPRIETVAARKVRVEGHLSTNCCVHVLYVVGVYVYVCVCACQYTYVHIITGYLCVL